MIRYDSDNTPFVEIDSNILDGISEEQWNKKVKEVLKKKFSNGIKVGNNGTRLYLYDVINLKEIKIKERRSNHQRYSQNGKMLNIVASSKSSISQNNKNDNNILKLRIDINAGKVSETEGHNIMILTLSHEPTVLKCKQYGVIT